MTGSPTESADGAPEPASQRASEVLEAARMGDGCGRRDGERARRAKLLADLDALARAKDLLEREIAQLAEECWQAGVDRTLIAGALGISRASLYRRYPRGGQGRPQAGEANP
jgi:DNA invertase Pin-like site-specific DNA recombinase